MIAFTLRTSTSRQATARAVQDCISVPLCQIAERSPAGDRLLEVPTEVRGLLEVRQLLYVRQPCDPTTAPAPNIPL